MGHSLLVEIRRPARRWTPGGWCRADTVNMVLLACWAEAALVLGIVAGPIALRLVGGTLAAGYAACCEYFVTERGRSIAARTCESIEVSDRVPAGPGF
jgi:hypothetical protein